VGIYISYIPYYRHKWSYQKTSTFHCIYFKFTPLLFLRGHITLNCKIFDFLTAVNMTNVFDTSSVADGGKVSEKYVDNGRKGFCIWNPISKPGLPLSPEDGDILLYKRWHQYNNAPSCILYYKVFILICCFFLLRHFQLRYYCQQIF